MTPAPLPVWLPLVNAPFVAIGYRHMGRAFAVRSALALAGLATPFTIGALSHSMGGLGNAVALVSIGPIIGAAIVILFAPETMGASLEELSAVAAD